MSNTKKAGAEDAPTVDPRDAELEALRAELAEAKAAQAAAAAPAAPRVEDATAAAMDALRAELAALKATPEGEAAETRRALLALQATVERMQSGAGLVPVPENSKPDPHLFGVKLDCGDVLTAAHPHGTHHHCAEHGTVPVAGYWNLSPEMLAAANA